MSSVQSSRFHPKEMLIWLYIGATAMLFGGFSSAYLVQRFSQYWKAISIPPVFWLNTGVLLLSSLTLIWAQRGYKQSNPWQLQLGLMATLALGVLFLMGQVLGWQLLVRSGVFLVGNNKSASYFYILSGLHALHLVGGIIVLGYWTFRALRYRVDTSSEVGLRMAATFWHALDVLWIYLIGFLQFSQNI